MCLIVFAYKYHPDYPLILAGNRDEFHSRSTKELHFWGTKPNLLAGKDLEAGGTWLGINEYGKLAAITNHRDLHNIKENAPSRGKIVTDLLFSEESTQTKLTSLTSEITGHNGFNLIAGSVGELYYLSNHGNHFDQLTPGLYVISNASLNTSWPKTDRASHKFSKLIKTGTLNDDEIFGILTDSETFPNHLLPETGLTPELEKAVSSIFILTDDYGTRSSALITIDSKNQARFVEKTYLPGTKQVINTEEIVFTLKR